MIIEQYSKKLQAMYFRKYNVQLTDEQATKALIDLMNLMEVLTKPLPKKLGYKIISRVIHC